MLPRDPDEGPSPFHAGEQAVQSRMGVRDQMEMIGRRILRDFMPDQHRQFFGQLPWLVIGSLDETKRPWASLRWGPPGFMSSPDARTLVIDAPALPGDPAAPTFVPGAPVGLLGIQPETRRRNRMNGTLVRADASGITVGVGQSFGNCPKYIQSRAPRFVAGLPDPAPPRIEGSTLSSEAVELIRRADTFYVASASRRARGGDPVEGVDVSHRGGRPGFVKVIAQTSTGSSIERAPTELAWPDFIGNDLFNTLGNFETHPHAGLVFIDFDSGGVLSLTCDVDIAWGGVEVASFKGAERVVHARVIEGAWLEGALPLRWSDVQPARENASLGAWNDG